jgi:hypothetical protein
MMALCSVAPHAALELGGIGRGPIPPDRRGDPSGDLPSRGSVAANIMTEDNDGQA